MLWQSLAFITHIQNNATKENYVDFIYYMDNLSYNLFVLTVKQKRSFYKS